METYLSVNYSKLEDGKHDYPQKLCDYITKAFFMKHCDIENKKILDVGSGKGNHLISFARAGMSPVGLDKRSECIKARNDIKIVGCDIENQPFPFENNTFDFVFSKSVCEHVNNTEGFFRESSRVLKKGGLGLFMTPDWASQSDHFWDDYTHVRPFTRKALQNALRMNGFKSVNCEYFLQLPFIWKFPALKFLTSILSLAPQSWKWKDKEESQFRPLIRFSKEKMLLAVGIKND